MTFKNGDRVRVVSLPDHTLAEREVMEGKVGTVTEAEGGRYIEVTLDEDLDLAVKNRHLLTESEIEHL